MHNFVLRPKPIAAALFVGALIFTLIHTALTLFVGDFNAAIFHEPLALFNMNAEASIPTWYSQFLLWTAAGILFVVGFTTKVYKRHWFGLGAVFVFLSMDEGAAIHELTTDPLRDLLRIETGLLYYTWVVLYLAAAAVLALIYIRFILALPRRTYVVIIIAATVFVAGAIGLEILGGSIAANSGETTTSYSLSVAAEEFLEMSGTTIFIYALLDYLARQKTKVLTSFRVSD